MEHNETQNSLSLGDLWSIFANHYLVIIAAAVLVFAANQLFCYTSPNIRIATITLRARTTRAARH